MENTNVILLAVFAGGGLGALLRYLTGNLIELVAGQRPLSTFVVNVVGCLLAGYLVGYFEARPQNDRNLMAFLSVGLLGGFTTFSAFGIDTLALLESRQFRIGLLYAAGSVCLSLLAAAPGQTIARSLVATIISPDSTHRLLKS